MLVSILSDELRNMVESRRWSELKERAAQWPPPELADLFMEMDGTDRILFFRALPRDLAGEVFAHLEEQDQTRLLQELTDQETRTVIREMEPDDRTHLLEELPGDVVRRLLNFLPPDELDEARTLLGYPEESIGRLMTPHYLMVRPEWTVQQALEHIRSRGEDYETVNIVYVVEKGGRLQDALGLRRLLLSDPETRIESLVRGPIISLRATDDREEAVRAMSRYDLSVLPVVDAEGVLLGIVTVDDVLDVAEEEATEDMHRMATVGELGASLPRVALHRLWRARVGWLLILVFMNVFSGAGIAYFEDTLEAMVALAFFLPLLIDSGGNAGSQSATLMVRALALGEVRMKDWFRLLGREVAVALLLGVTMAAAVSVVAAYRAPQILVPVAFTMVCVVLVGSLVGMLLPFALTRFKLDPATASAPLVTSIADICGVLIYFSVATKYLGVGS